MSRATSWEPSQLEQDRRRYRSRRTTRTVLRTVVLTLVVAAVIVVVVGRSSGWQRVRSSYFDVSIGWHDVPDLLRALWLNVQIMLISEVLVLVLASVIAVVRTLRGPAFFPLRFLAALYTDVFRGIPLLVMFYLIGFGIPALRLTGAPSSPFVLGIITLTVTYTAYVAEVLRAGIESVHPSQRASARALGLTYGQTLRYVVFPQGVRRVIPPLINDFVSLQKDTSLVSILGLIEVVLTALNQQSQNYKFVSYVIAALMFLVLTIPFTRVTDWLARRQGWVNAGSVI